MSRLRRWLFNLWYYRRPPWDTGVSPPELMSVIASRPPGRALDLGCGTGTNVITLAQHGWQVVGVDFAPRAIRLAQRKARHAGVQADFHVGDVTQLDWLDGPFDLILDMGCYHSLNREERARYREHVARLLADDGVYLLYVFFKEAGQSGPGLLPNDVDEFAPSLHLVQRQDGSERGRRPSAWLTFTRLPHA